MDPENEHEEVLDDAALEELDEEDLEDDLEVGDEEEEGDLI